MRAMLFASVLGVMVWSALIPVAQADDPQVTKSGESLKGASKKYGDLTVTQIKAGALPCVFWADAKGSAFYAITPAGAIRRISFPDLKETVQADLQSRCTYLAPSAEGLVVSVSESQEVWLLDEATFKVKAKIAVPNLHRCVSAYPLSIGVAVNKAGRDNEIFEVDFKAKTSKKYAGERPKHGGYWDPVITPDGKFVFTGGHLYGFNRWGIVNGKLKYMETKTDGFDGSTVHIPQVSADSKYFVLGTYTGNGGEPRGQWVFKSNNIQSPEFTVARQAAVVGVDEADGYVYAAHPRGPFRLHSMKGDLIKEYKLDGTADPKQILAHPSGNQALYVEGGKFSLVEAPKK